MRSIVRPLLVLVLGFAAPAAELLRVQDAAMEQDLLEQQHPSIENSAVAAGDRLARSIAELGAQRDRIATERLPLALELSALENELLAAKAQFNETKRVLDRRQLDLGNLRSTIEQQRAETTYVESVLEDYARNFDSRLAIAERKMFEEVFDSAISAGEIVDLAEREAVQRRLAILTAALDRTEAALGGRRFDGTAVDVDGRVVQGTFALVGPVTLFRSSDGTEVGSIDQRIGSKEPAIYRFASADDVAAADRFVAIGSGEFPFDASLGDALAIEATRETFLEHVEKGGPVMIPIFVLAGLALLVALYRWIGLATIRSVSRREIGEFLTSVEQRDEEGAKRRAAAMRGPVGEMLRVGSANLRESRDVIEEAMYETVLTWRFRLQRMLPFIAICAASAPLLGLLGTVTGIISTFRMITVFGSSDVKSLSGGISEALITTKFGLIVAIPALLIHAFLSRRARGVVGKMETAAVALVNQVSKTPLRRVHARSSSDGDREVDGDAARLDPDLVREQIREILGDLLGPIGAEVASSARDRERVQV